MRTARRNPRAHMRARPRPLSRRLRRLLRSYRLVDRDGNVIPLLSEVWIIYR